MSTTAAPWGALPEPSEAPPVQVDPDAQALTRLLVGFIALAAGMDDRSRQVVIGSSEAGHPCDRRVAYRVHGLPPLRRLTTDPLRALIGAGTHAVLAELFHRLDAATGAFLVERKLSYRGIPGTADLVYRFGKTVIDWKSTTAQKIKRVRREGVPRTYQVQVQLYAAGLIEAGEDITHCAIVYIPVDSTVDDVFVHLTPVDQRIAEDAAERVDRLRKTPPSQASIHPDRLCPWCPNYRPGSTDLDTGCPGE